MGPGVMRDLRQVYFMVYVTNFDNNVSIFMLYNVELMLEDILSMNAGKIGSNFVFTRGYHDL